MADAVDNNKIIDGELNDEAPEFKYDFISIPWDDRSQRSKIGIIVLLVSMAVGILAVLVASFTIHYRGYSRSGMGEFDNCKLVQMEDHKFVARIHSAASHKILCVGAVLTENKVLTNRDCLKRDNVKLRLGNPYDLFCRKWYYVKNTIRNAKNIPKHSKLAILLTYENMNKCSTTIGLGTSFSASQAYVIGRPFNNELSTNMLSLQDVLILPGEMCGFDITGIDKKLCVKVQQLCPIAPGDLLVRQGRLVGVADTSFAISRNNTNSKNVLNKSITLHTFASLFMNEDNITETTEADKC